MKLTLKLTTAALAIAASICGGSPASASVEYNIAFDLGQAALTNLQGSYTLTSYKGTEAYTLNDSGVIAGIVWGKYDGYSSNLRMLTTWTNGIPTVAGLPIIGGHSGKSDAYGINSSGTIVGYSNLSGNPHPYIFDYGANYNGGLGYDLYPPPGYTYATATSINDSGAVVGYATKVGATSAFINVNGAPYYSSVISQAIGNSAAYSINNSGLVTGYFTDSGNERAFIWDSGSDAFTSLGTLGGLTSSGSDINDNGAVVGSSLLSDGVTSHAFLYTNGTMQDLGAMTGTASQANAVNNAGVVVGSFTGTFADGFTSHAFVYKDGQMFDLNDLIPTGSGYTFTNATAINNNGQILAEEVLGPNGSSQQLFTVLLDPVPTPIPAALPLFVSGLAALGLWRRRFFPRV
jgi:probable HAF family extracellular repeat protein